MISLYIAGLALGWFVIGPRVAHILGLDIGRHKSAIMLP